MGGGGVPMEETVVNNYYDSPGERHGEHSFADTSDDQDYANDDDTQVQDADYDDSSSNDDTDVA